MPKLEIHESRLEAADGTELRYFDTGDTSKPPIILANGLGGPLTAWKPQILHLRDRYRVISWDYRGLYGSALPPGAHPDLSIQAHVDDLLHVIAAANVERAAFLGWSMGVQIILELYHQRPELVSNMVLVNGTFGRPLHGVGVPFSGSIIPYAVEQARNLHHIGNAILQRASKWPETGPWLKRLGVISRTLDDELFTEMVTDFGTLDLDIYFHMLSMLGKHDAEHVLPSIRIPTLIIAGAKDLMTPPRAAEKMVRRIPHGELLVVRGATHYAAAEYPELVNLRIDKFFHEHRYGPSPFVREAV